MLNSGEKKGWGDKVIEQLDGEFDLEHDKFIFLAGNEYIKPIIGRLINSEMPFNGLSMGRRVEFLKKHVTRA